MIFSPIDDYFLCGNRAPLYVLAQDCVKEKVILSLFVTQRINAPMRFLVQNVLLSGDYVVSVNKRGSDDFLQVWLSYGASVSKIK